ncbi:MAG: hypothetical protein QME94_01385 [Anaerolineae bacterium]|nr:hypothetical protein [Anaerolineae bacterium]
MSESEPETPQMTCSLRFALLDERGEEISAGEGQVALASESLSLEPKLQPPLLLSLRDIVDVSAAQYALDLALVSGETLKLSHLGHRYEDFVRVLRRLRNEVLLTDMLAQESLQRSGVAADFLCADAGGREAQRGRCEVRLYDTAIVLIPEQGDIVRVPYSDVARVDDSNHVLTIASEYGEQAVLSKMGREHDSLVRSLSAAMNALALKVQATIRELLPEASPAVLRRASQLLKEGRAARRADIEALSPDLWKQLVKHLDLAGLREGYDFLTSLGQPDKISIGIKRGLMGELTGEYVWFVVPIYASDSTRPGNAVVMEAGSAEGEGRATYLYRILSRADYARPHELAELHAAADRCLATINRCMQAVNFRREPIYLSERRLAEPQYARYRYAIKKLPALQELRRLFIGRVAHSTAAQWKDDIMDLLRFNVSTQDDQAVWRRKAPM